MSIRPRRLGAPQLDLRGPGALAVAVLVMVPVVTFAVPALAGHPLVSTDDLIQNYPLRVLVARNLTHGHLPLWNPYIWSGTALLGGLNAGALYPGTLLFTVLPAEVAWVLNEIAVYVVAALGLYVFLRRSRLSVGAAFLGSLSFTVGGFMSAQLGHIDLVQGVSLVPWMLVALQRMAHPPPVKGAPPGAAKPPVTTAGGGAGAPTASEEGGDGAPPGAAKPPVTRPTVLLGLCLVLLVLTGSPEAIVDSSVLVAIYGGWLAWHHRDGRIVVQLGIAATAAVALTAIQWLPALDFTSHSQRSASTYAFFTSGSFPPKLTALTAMPYLLGGYGRFGVPLYHGQYNLAEVSTYIGILPVCAAFAMLTRPWRSRRVSEGLGVWYVLIAVGLVLSFGGYTPLGHLLAHIPVYGQQRLQNRNMLTVDLGLAVLFAHWIDGIRQRVGPHHDRPSPLERAAALVPVVCLIGLVAALVASPVVLSQELGSPVPLGSFHRLEGYLAAGLVLAVLGGLLAAGWDRVPRRLLLRAVLVLVVVDLAIYSANQYWLTAPPRSSLTDTTGMASAVAAQTGPTGRFAIYDPDQSDPVALNDLGQPDLNVLRSLGSVQGYGSVVSGDYDRATGSHQQSDLSASALFGSTFDDLNLTTLVTRPGYFTQPPGTVTASTGPLPETVPSQGQRTWNLGSPLRLTGVSVQLHQDPGCTLPSGGLGLGLLTPDGATVAAPPMMSLPNASNTAGVALDGRTTAVGIVVVNGATCPLTVDSASVTTHSGRMLLAGPLQGAVTAPKWQFVQTLGSFVVFRNTAARGRFWVVPADGGPAPTAALRVADDPLTGDQKVVVTTSRPSRVVRSVAVAPGWSATVQPARSGAASYRVSVPASGTLVQSVPVPAGTSTVAWRYGPASVTIGAVTSLAAVVALVAFALVWWFRGAFRPARGRRDPGESDRTGR
ncbi:MAG TPA: hypothetical protein VG476_10100 [Acidimicrobiales bacterium]|nr:hypothetical protein [Acidimicrobiales bacterium]